MEKEPFIIGVTGHRPARIKGQEQEIKNWFETNIKNFIAAYDNVVVISGMARGVDQIAAAAALKCGARLWCYFPYRHELKGLEKQLAESADLVLYETDKYTDASCYIKRDKRIVDDCDIMLIVYDEQPVGGTYQTYKYAKGYKDTLVYEV